MRLLLDRGFTGAFVVIEQVNGTTVYGKIIPFGQPTGTLVNRFFPGVEVDQLVNVGVTKVIGRKEGEMVYLSIKKEVEADPLTKFSLVSKVSKTLFDELDQEVGRVEIVFNQISLNTFVSFYPSQKFYTDVKFDSYVPYFDFK